MSVSSFRGQFSFLSNFYLAPFRVPGSEVWATCVESAYQGLKVENLTQREKVFAMYPACAKRVTRYITYRPEFHNNKIAIMKQLVSAKFKQNPSLGAKLINTYPYDLIEENRWGDIFWGCCDGVGDNHLGKILMTVRDELRSSL